MLEPTDLLICMTKKTVQISSGHNMQDSCSVAKTGHCFIPQVHPQLHLTPFLLLLYLAVVQCIPVLLQWLWIMGIQRTCTDRYTWTPTPKHTLYYPFPAAWYFPTNPPHPPPQSWNLFTAGGYSCWLSNGPDGQANVARCTIVVVTYSGTRCRITQPFLVIYTFIYLQGMLELLFEILQNT